MDDNVESAKGVSELDDSASNSEKDEVQILDCKNDKDDIIVSKVIMEIDDINEIYEFYRCYAVGTGFGCKICSSKKDDGILRHVTYTCVREGKHKPNSVIPFKLDPTPKCECKAKITTCLDSDNKRRITVFVSEHTHRTSPSKTRFMRCNKLIKKSTRRKLFMNDKAGIIGHKIFYMCAVEAGGPENITYDEKDLRNMIAKEKRLELGEGDATALQNHFKRLQKLNIDFFYNIDMDSENRLKNDFWAYKRCREAYKEFDEVITFDTTYFTNKYDMPFAPFVGLNHHGKIR